MECVRASPRFKRQATPLPEESIARNFIISQKYYNRQTPGRVGPVLIGSNNSFPSQTDQVLARFCKLLYQAIGGISSISPKMNRVRSIIGG